MGGAAAVFAAVSVASGYVLSNYCSDTFLLVAGLVEGFMGEGSMCRSDRFMGYSDFCCRCSRYRRLDI